MNKGELIDAMSFDTGVLKKDVEVQLNAFLKIVERKLVEGEKVQLVGFGTFDIRERKARQGRNPRNPEEVIDIPAKTAPVFKAGKGLKDAVEASNA